VIRVQLRGAQLDRPRAQVEMIASQLTDFRLPLTTAAAYVREQTRQRFEARGFGEWPPLAESTVARKKSKGAPDPPRQLYEFGDLYESVSSAHGPYSFTVLEPTFVLIGVDWQRGGWQIPVLLSEGTPRMPARPIWPPHYQVAVGVSRIIRNWVRAPVEPLSLGGAGGPWTGASTTPLEPF
jgi:hypothetical protein